MNKPILFPITYQCNLNCIYCSEKNKRNINIDILKSIELIKHNNNEWVYITGGEPLLIDNITEICKELKSTGKKVGLTTNGTLHNFNVLNEIDRIGISIDGDEQFTDNNRGIGTYQKALTYLKKASLYPIETVIMSTMIERNKIQENFLENLGNNLNITYLQVTLC